MLLVTRKCSAHAMPAQPQAPAAYNGKCEMATADDAVTAGDAVLIKPTLYHCLLCSLQLHRGHQGPHSPATAFCY